MVPEFANIYCIWGNINGISRQFIFIIRMQREQAQILRQQQDQAYLDSLKADQEKVKEHHGTPLSS